MSLFSELKRRNVLRVGAAYIVVSWLIIQVVETIFPAFGFGDAAIRIAVIILATGFVPAVILAWAFELTPDGFKKDKDLDRTQPIDPRAGKKLNRVILVVLVLALVYFAADKFFLDPARDRAELESALENASLRARDDLREEDLADRSIAVLPFVNMSSDPEQEYFSDGLSEELLNLLAGIKTLKVAARTSSFFYKNKMDTITLQEVAQTLGVAHILEGSVRKSGDRLRITVQLIKAEDGFHLWSETYDRKLDDVFTIQDEIAATVVESLKVTLLDELPHSRISNTQAYELTLQARFFYNRRADGDLERAFDHFRRAVELDQGIAEAWIGMAPMYMWLYDPPDVEGARHAIETALAIDPENPEANIRLAQFLLYDGHEEQGLREFRRALERWPDNQLVLSINAGDFYLGGDLDRAIKLQARAVAMDPLHAVNIGNLAGFLESAGRLDEALEHARNALELSPGPDSFKALARIRLLQGYPAEALDYVQKIPEDHERQYYLANTQFSLGNIGAADEAMTEFDAIYASEWPIFMAGMYAWRGEADQAFLWLHRTLKENPDMGIYWTYDQFLNTLHDDPRWAAFISNWDVVIE